MDTIKKSPVTWALIIINTVIWLGVEITGGSENVENMIRWGAQYAPLVQMGEYYRLFTCMFLHFGLGHLINNMLTLYFVGSVLELAAGKIRFLIIYLAGGLGASVISYAFDMRLEEYAVSAGASGAIFAVVGGVLWALVRNRGRIAGVTIQQMVFMVVLSLYMGFTSTGVDNTAHVGGLLVGIVLCVVIYHPRRRGVRGW